MRCRPVNRRSPRPRAAQQRAYHHGDLKNTLVSTGSDLLEELGVEALSLRDLARRAGVSHMAPYRHFADKDALLQELAGLGFAELARVVRASTADSADPGEQLRSANYAYIRLAVAHPERTRLMFGGVIDLGRCTPELQALAGDAFASLTELVATGQATGHFLPGDTRKLALTVWSGVHGFAMLYTGGQIQIANPDGRELRALCDMLTESMLHGIGRQQPSRRPSARTKKGRRFP